MKGDGGPSGPPSVMVGKRSENVNFGVVRKQSFDDLIENCIRTWEVQYPEDAKAFYAQCQRRKTAAEKLHDPKSDLWFGGQIPSSLELMFFRLCGEHLGDEDLARIFRVFTAGQAPKLGKTRIIVKGEL